MHKREQGKLQHKHAASLSQSTNYTKGKNYSFMVLGMKETTNSNYSFLEEA